MVTTIRLLLARVRAHDKSSHLHILPAALLVFGVNLFVRVIAAGKELVVAYHFGVRSELAAYLFAYLFPATVLNFVGAALAIALVPAYVGTRDRMGPDAARDLAGRLAAKAMFILLVAAAGVAAIGPYLVRGLAAGFDAVTLARCQSLVVVLSPLLVISGMSSVWCALLNAEHRYALAAGIPLLTPILVVSCLLVAGENANAMTLAAGILLGAVAECLTAVSAIRRIGLPWLRMRLSWNAGERAVGREFFVLSLANAVMAGCAFIEQAFLAATNAENVAAYSYGTRLTTVAASVLVTAVSAVLLPHFSSVVASGGGAKLRREASRVAIVTGAMSLLPAAFLFFCSAGVTRLVFQRGSFGAPETMIVSVVQQAHALFIPVYAIGLVAVRVLNSSGGVRWILAGSVLNILVILVSCALLVPNFGAAGAAISDVVMYTISTVFLWSAFLRRTATQPAGMLP
ncbi:MAG: hypothetical protein JSR73_02760 [Proteobacteria bacterium]|nr:hypothetical protein [Pseudomonadota bacterium]